MSAAWDAGVTLFDTARSYGYGEAEALLGEFLAGKRKQATIITKFGITARAQPVWRRAAKPVVRAALSAVPSLRARLRRGLANEMSAPAFSVAGLNASLEASLRALRTDTVDVLLAHEAPASLMQQDDLMDALAMVVKAGKALRVGISGSQQVAASVVSQGSALLSVVQFPANRWIAAETSLRSAKCLRIANHTFGGALRVREMQAKLAAMRDDPRVSEELRERLRGDLDVVLAEIVFSAVQRETGAEWIVASMMQPKHLQANVAAMGRGYPPLPPGRGCGFVSCLESMVLKIGCLQSIHCRGFKWQRPCSCGFCEFSTDGEAGCGR
jgi:aryl-alcohol dehydrogenase-like predicted oxidoreductase